MKILSTIALLIVSLGLAENARGHCLPGHTGVAIPLTEAMISKFCSDYSIAKPAQQLEYKEAYDQYCGKPPVLTMVSVKDNCLTRGRDVTISGQNFGTQGSVYLARSGKDNDLQVRSWSDTQVRATITMGVDPGKSYGVWVKTASGKSSQKSLTACKEKIEAPVVDKTPAGFNQKDQADLVVKLAGPDRASAGEAIPKLVVEAANLGQATASGYAISLVLSRYQRLDVNPLGMQSMTDDQVLETIPLTDPLLPNGKKEYRPRFSIPDTVAAGHYYLCVQIDPDNKVGESNENNNTTCQRIEVTAEKQDAPVAAVQLGRRAREVMGKNRDLDVGRMDLADWFKEWKPVVIQPLMVFPNALTVNGSMGRVDIAAGGRADVGWTFPPETANSAVFLRVSSSPFTVLCPDDGVAFDAGRATLDTADADSADRPDRTSRPGSSSVYTLNLTGGSYAPGEVYYVQACGLRTTAGSPVFTGDETNTVELRYEGPAEEEQPDLEILNVVYGTLRPGAFQGRDESYVVVRNNGRTAADVLAAYTHPSRGSSRDTVCTGGWAYHNCPLYSVGEPVNIPAGETRSLPLHFGIFTSEAPRFLRSGFSTAVFLFDARERIVPGRALAGLWRDGNMANHQRRVTVEVQPFDDWAVRFHLSKLEVLRSCDEVSAGDWVLDLTMTPWPLDPWYSDDDRELSRPYREEYAYAPHQSFMMARALDVNAGQVLTDVASTPFIRVPAAEADVTSLIVEVHAIDCDRPFGGPIYYSRTYIGACDRAEEYGEWTESGQNEAEVGTIVARFGPALWKRGGTAELHPSWRGGEVTPRNHCGDGAFRATITFEATPFWRGPYD